MDWRADAGAHSLAYELDRESRTVRVRSLRVPSV